jgi:N6-L-threonylcarbamoyladenine synthase
MKILAIETSCDDTCVAILEIKGKKLPHFKILSDIVSSQVKIHAKYGGVYPFLAKREHQKNLPIVFKKVFKKAKKPDIDLIAVTVGPGLEPCLWVGVNFAKDLAKNLDIPLIPVNHIEAHILTNFINSNTRYKIQDTRYIFPAICLVASGGHTQLILMHDFGKYKILGETRDDAAGECFDKAARILGLGYPGGPAIAKEATKLQTINYKLQTKLPRPMIYQKNYDFSFSGLKTAVLYHSQNQTPKIRRSKKYIQAMCREVQQSIIDVLIYKTLKAAKEYKARSIILGGGVTANSELRKQFEQRITKEVPNTKYIIPNTKYCTDNALMAAVAGYFNREKGERYNLENIEADANLTLPRS